MTDRTLEQFHKVNLPFDEEHFLLLFGLLEQVVLPFYRYRRHTSIDCGILNQFHTMSAMLDCNELLAYARSYHRVG